MWLCRTHAFLFCDSVELYIKLQRPPHIYLVKGARLRTCWSVHMQHFQQSLSNEHKNSSLEGSGIIQTFIQQKKFNWFVDFCLSLYENQTDQGWGCKFRQCWQMEQMGFHKKNVYLNHLLNSSSVVGHCTKIFYGWQKVSNQMVRHVKYSCDSYWYKRSNMMWESRPLPFSFRSLFFFFFYIFFF